MDKEFRILILEDVPTDAELIERELRKAGVAFTSRRVETREAFLSSLDEFRPDIILSDYSLPQFNGLEALCLLREGGHDIPFLLITGSLTEEVAVECMKTGATDYILKTSLKRLSSAVKNALEKAEARRAKEEAVEALRESEQRYRFLGEGILHQVWTAQPDGRFDYVNGRTLEYFGRTMEQMLGGAWLDAVHPDDVPACVERWTRSLQTGEYYEMEFRLRRADGEYRWHWARATAGRDADGSIIKWFGTNTDIHDQKLAEEALRESEEQYRTLFDSIDEGFGVIEMLFDEHGRPIDYRFLEVNPAFEKQSGLERAVGKTARELTPNLEEHWLETYGRVALTGEPVRFENRAVALNRWFDVYAFRVGGAESRKVAILFNDITERKQLAEDRERFFSLSTDLLVIAGFDGHFKWISPAWERIFGWTAGELTAHPWLHFVHPEDQEKTVAEAEKLFEGRETVSFENRYRHKDGSWRWLSWKARPYMQEQLLYCAATDITERKQSEEALRESEEQLRQSQKMESVGVLAGGVAHDFNNLLTAISGNTQLALRKLAPDDPLRQRLSEVEKAAQRAAMLTRQLLAFSRRQHLERRIISLNDTVNEMMKLLRRIIGEDVEVEVKGAPDLSPVYADPAQIEQVLMNLCVNARDAMPGGGRLRIETRNVELDEAYGRQHSYMPPGRYVEIRVSDTGTGMDAETRARIFEPFFTTKEVGKGTGLGLSMVYGIVKQHEGHINVYSESGLGTTFKVYFPAAARPAAEEDAPAQLPLLGGAETILIAEDEDALRELARDILEGLGYTVLLAKDGEEAVRVFNAESARVDLVLLDVVMPRVSGREAYERIRALCDGVPAIFMTGYTAEMVQDKFVAQNRLMEESGAVLIRKPYSVEDLGRKVREVLDARGRTNGKAGTGKKTGGLKR